MWTRRAGVDAQVRAVPGFVLAGLDRLPVGKFQAWNVHDSALGPSSVSLRVTAIQLDLDQCRSMRFGNLAPGSSCDLYRVHALNENVIATVEKVATRRVSHGVTGGLYTVRPHLPGSTERLLDAVDANVGEPARFVEGRGDCRLTDSGQAAEDDKRWTGHTSRVRALLSRESQDDGRVRTREVVLGVQALAPRDVDRCG